MTDGGRSHRAGRVAGLIVTGAAAYLLLASGYLVALVLAAARARGDRRNAEVADLPCSRFVIVIPAHDEEAVIGQTLDAVAALEGPATARDVVVVADQCGDRTAEIAAVAGARVLRRSDGPRGKGAAIRWALDTLGGLDPSTIVLVLDADCIPSPNLLTAIDRRIIAGARVVQVDYIVANPDASGASALRHAAFALMNTVRPMGKEALGLSAGLRGTGMAFVAATLAKRGWDTSTLVEDHEHHYALVAAGERVVFAADAHVSSPMPTSFRGALDQQMRWESGRWPLLRRWGPRLVAGAVRHRDVVRADAVLDMLIPSQSLLLAANLTVLGAGVRLRSRSAVVFAIAALAGQIAFVLGGLRVARVPPATYRALLYAPVAVVQKLLITGRIARGGAPREFIRTSRETSAPRGSDADAAT